MRGLWAAAEAEPDRVALVDGQGRARTAGEIIAASHRLVHGLRAHGLGPGDCIAVMLQNGLSWRCCSER